MADCRESLDEGSTGSLCGRLSGVFRRGYYRIVVWPNVGSLKTRVVEDRCVAECWESLNEGITRSLCGRLSGVFRRG